MASDFHEWDKAARRLRAHQEGDYLYKVYRGGTPPDEPTLRSDLAIVLAIDPASIRADALREAAAIVRSMTGWTWIGDSASAIEALIPGGAK